MVEQAQSMEELMRDAEVAEEPGDIRQGSTVASTSNGMTMTASELNSAGYVYVYDTQTGARSTVNRNMLAFCKKDELTEVIFSPQKCLT